jgi:methyl-accepting chemotaxis protein
VLEFGEINAQSQAMMRWLWTAQSSAAASPERASMIAQARQAIAAAEAAQEKFLEIPGGEDVKAVLKQAQPDWQKSRVLVEKVLATLESSAPDSDVQSRALIVSELRPQLRKFAEGLEAVRAKQKAVILAAQKDSEEHVNKAVAWLTGVAALAFCFSLAFSAFWASRIVSSITSVVGSLKGVSGSLGSASVQIAASSSELASAATEQAASLAETATAIQEMASMVAKSADNAQSTARTAQRSQERASKGKQVMGKMVDAIGEITQSNDRIISRIEQSKSEFDEIIRVIRAIESKTKVINDIVFQTKLLSFNASVEAARAGEHGKGFAVVAEEVGALALMSGNAAHEISQMLDGSVKKVEQIVAATNSEVGSIVIAGQEKVRAGENIAGECSTVLQEIFHDSVAVSQMAEEISSASREQSLGVSEISKAMEQLDQVTQQNSAASSQTSSAAESLAGQATELQKAVADLISVVDGARSAVFASPDDRSSGGAHFSSLVADIADRDAA